MKRIEQSRRLAVRHGRRRGISCVLGLLVLAGATQLHSAPVSDVSNTQHNLSTSGSGQSKATGESQICVFCHTPHGATLIAAPLWNRELSGATYTPYSSASIDAADIASLPENSSKLCLSCHDGTLAIGNVNVANGQENVSITMTGTDPDGTMRAGTGALTGFTRDLGTDLRNDHPISFTYDSALAAADGELRDPAAVAHIATRTQGVKPAVPLEDGQLECISCHDPHIRDSDPSVNRKFLRLNRFQLATPAGGAFDANNDIVCLACHDKMGTAWSESAHAKSAVADELYKAAAASDREFPASIQVWQAACLNCHDTHTVQGARRLAREGTDSTATPKSGGNSAIEETCYQCHTTSAASILNNAPDVPDIKTDFTTLARRMPITSSAQDAGSEVHDIRDADFTESQALLGLGNLDNRHVECTDCHNPHRVLKNALFNGTGGSTAATHNHAAGHTNIASGTLTGTWGVEPNWNGSPPTPTFYQLPNSYTVKQGAPAIGASTAVTNSYVTREYQVCLKCHSDYGYSDANLTTSNWDSGRPDMNGPGLTGANPTDQANFNVYSNQAREFAPYNSAGSTGATFTSNNHRSWHPVIAATGRTNSSSTRRNTNWQPPWDGSADIGVQTMYCTDCHGANTASNSSGAANEGGNNFGPHGSSNRFILKGDWSNSTNEICFKCHDSSFYNSTSGTSGSAFQGNSGSATHGYHRERIGSLQCNWCHVAVPHGWKNRSLLVNLRDVGPEAGVSPGTEISNSSLPYTRGPYYMRAYQKINSFPSPGSWNENNCLGKNWMTDNCVN
jgi:hypothetical protein